MASDLSTPVGNLLLESTGLLHEINRRVLHPVGYHMSVRVADDITLAQSLVVQPVESLVGGIMDSDEFLRGAAKFATFLAEKGAAVIKARIREYDFIEQESPFVEDEGPALGPAVK